MAGSSKERTILRAACQTDDHGLVLPHRRYVRCSDMIESNLTTPEPTEEDIAAEKSLRPSRLSGFIGQEEVVANLQVYIESARRRKKNLDHVILFGPPGLGKTTLAYIIARELNVNIKVSSGPVLDRPADLAGILTNLGERDVFFVDEIHRMNSSVEEYLYSAMEDYRIDIMLDKGPNSRSIQLSLAPFTLIGATTRMGNLTSPLRERFGVILRLDFYAADELKQIITRSAELMDITIDSDAADQIAKRSRGTPRIANRILRRSRDFAEVDGTGHLDLAVAKQALKRLGIDDLGLDDMDRRILNALVKSFHGGPVGVETLAVALHETSRTIEEVYEPFLIKEGFLQRTSRGRIALERTYAFLNVELPPSSKLNQQRLF